MASSAWLSPEPWVFTTPVGTPVDHSNLTQRLKKAGGPSMTFHGLRHSAATRLLESGVPLKVASELLGHSSVRITADIYSHVTEPLLGTATAALEEAYRSTRGTASRGGP